MKCRICGQITATAGAADHHLQPSPLGAECMGCASFALELRLFYIRATGMGSEPMGDWISGWLKAIVADPTKYRD